MFKKRYLFVFVVLTVFLIIFLKIKTRPKSVYKTISIGQGRIETLVSSSGTVRSEVETKVQFQASGKLVWLGVKEGDRVKKWQALASLDKESLKKSFEKAMNDYLTYRWDFEQKRADYKFQSDHALITDDIRRIFDKTQFSLNKAVLDVEIANLAVKYATIYSPIEGIVTKVEPSVAGINIIYSSAYVEIADPQKMEFEAIVDEADIGKLKVGQTATITLDAFPEEKFLGVIKRLAFKSTTTSSGGTGFSIFVSFPAEAMAKLRIGLNGDFEVITEVKDQVLLIPSDSLLEIGDKKYAFKYIDGKVVQTEVTTGLINEDKVEIVGGLREGDLLILEGVGSLKNGQKVTVR